MATLSALHQTLPLDGSRKLIRLLKVEPGQWNEDIRTKLHVASLRRAARDGFSALSYVWGQLDPDAEQHVWVNGHAIPVTPNLFLALRLLCAHAREKALVMWIDALCIDQSSSEERSQQVGMMGDIYRKCGEGLVWLGDFEARFGTAIPDCWSFTGDGSDYSGPSWLRYLDSFGVEDFNQDISIELGERIGIDKIPGICIVEDRVRGLQNLRLADAVFHFAWFLRQLLLAWEEDRHLDASWKMVPHNLFVPPERVSRDWRGYWSRTRELLSVLTGDAWFRRLWVVQELALPVRVQFFFGPISMPLKMFKMVFGFLMSTRVLEWDGGAGTKTASS
ncbi:heterokaryon incompatibility protein [Colletotrichum plurivorum]|uniref:Heterokaryon incompatibility protein n=1 Tax=Colletotrichum plurivorum TaxID=2175906 RepID=A0A8H6N7P7_9PEZI|nr:heterokaryon incompatibility protein [Colletotrichum plurivorum]